MLMLRAISQGTVFALWEPDSLVYIAQTTRRICIHGPTIEYKVFRIYEYVYFTSAHIESLHVHNFQMCSDFILRLYKTTPHCTCSLWLPSLHNKKICIQIVCALTDLAAFRWHVYGTH